MSLKKGIVHIIGAILVITILTVGKTTQNIKPLIGEYNNSIKKYQTHAVEQKGFDLAVRTFITNINGKELVDENGKFTREPNIDLTNLINGSSTTAEYKGSKNPVTAAAGDIVILTIRIYNEGGISGYASSVTNYLPPQLKFVMNDDENFNAQYGWRIDSSFRKATTNILGRPEIDPEDTIIKAFDGETLDYKELKIKCKLVSTNYIEKNVTNIVEITDFTDANGNPVIDRDSEKANVVELSEVTDETLPDYKGNKSNKSVLVDNNYFYKGEEDDDDFEKIILEEFDLALRTFITKINQTEITNRVPIFKNEDKNYFYEQVKDVLEVERNDIIEYTVRIYNEGDIAGYAKEIKDVIPEGLKFLPQNLTNQKYRWIMIDENGRKTEDITKAVAVTTDYLSREQEIQTERENLLERFNSTKISPDYREIKIVFQVEGKSTIENMIQISSISDENGRPIEDRDSTPNRWDKIEDDQDIEEIKVKSFAIGDIIAQVIPLEDEEKTENNQENISETQKVLNILKLLFLMGAIPIL